MYCKECGEEIKEKTVICPNCGCRVKKEFSTEKNKLVALLLWFFLGGFGVHRFYVGDISGGIVYVVCLFLSWLIVPGIILFVIWIVDLIEILNGKLRGVDLD